nr:hypothetical protein [Tanacetum cinerariifolium]
MNSLREVKSQFKFLSETLQYFGTMPIFKRAFSQDLDLLEHHLTKDILSQTDCNTTLTILKTKFKNAFNSGFKERMQKNIRFNAQSFQDAMICNMDPIRKYMREIILHQQRAPQLLKQKQLMQTQEDHSNPIQELNVDSLKVDLVVTQNTCSEKEDSNSKTASSKSVKESSLDSTTKDVHAIKYKITHIKHGFKWPFMSLFGQDADTFTSTMLHNVDQLQKKLDKDEVQEDASMAAFWVTQESKIDMGKAVDDDLVITESIGIESEVQDDSSRSGNDTDVDDADIRPIYDEEPMAEVQLTAECNIFAIGQQHTEQPEIINEGHRFSPNKTSAVYEKTSSRSDLRWKPTGRIFKFIGLRWIPTGNLFDSCTSKVDSEPPHGSNVNISNIHECKQTLDSMVAEKADISETIVKVDSQMMIQKNDV